MPLRTEAEIYNALGLPFIPPELREDMGEVEAGLAGTLPELIRTSDVRGTFHVHTDMSDGVDGLEKLVEAAKKRGLSYLGIADHSKSAYYAGGLKGDAIRRQWDEIDVFNQEHPDFYLFKGIESDILLDGSLDYDDEILQGFDFVIASVHSSFTLGQADMEKRIIRAMENPCTTMLGHPTGRLLLAREGYRIDMRNIIEAAATHHVIIELNASPYRLDIDWRHLRIAKQRGVMIAVNPDAHSASGLDDMYYGLDMARKGWQEKRDILNTRTVEEVKKIFGEMRHEKRG
jgi:DNA polymerase (family X)